jgi:hypothetical protein
MRDKITRQNKKSSSLAKNLSTEDLFTQTVLDFVGAHKAV